jgi:hypothetical protein
VCVRKHRDGRLSIHGMARVSLQDPRDFDRIIGVVLGKRAANNEAIDMLLHGLSLMDDGGDSSGAKAQVARMMIKQLFTRCSPWSIGLSPHASTGSIGTGNISPRDGGGDRRFDDQEEEEEELLCTSANRFSSSSSSSASHNVSPSQTLLLTITVSTPAGVSNTFSTSSSRPAAKSQTFSFVCPCGAAWGRPSADIGVLASTVSALPHAPPPSVLRSSLLVSLLLDNNNNSTDSRSSEFISLCSVRRPADDSAIYPSGGGARGNSSVNMEPAALHALRVVGQLSK